MADVKKKTQKSETQPAEKTEKKEVKKVAPKAPAAPKMTPNKMCRDLLLERSMTDEAITERILAVFPGNKFNKAYVSATRVALNQGYYKSVEEDLEKNPIPRLVEWKDDIIPVEEMRELREKEAEEEKAKKVEEKKAKQEADEAEAKRVFKKDHSAKADEADKPVVTKLPPKPARKKKAVKKAAKK